MRNVEKKRGLSEGMRKENEDGKMRRWEGV